MSLGGWGKPTQVAATQKDTHKHLPSKFRPAAQGRTEEQKHRQWFPRTSRVLVALQFCWESHFEAAAEIDVPNTLKARTTTQRHTEPIDTPKPTYYWTLHCTSERRDSARPTRTQAQALPTRKISQDTNPMPSTEADSTTKNYDLGNLFKIFFWNASWVPRVGFWVDIILNTINSARALRMGNRLEVKERRCWVLLGNWCSCYTQVSTAIRYKDSGEWCMHPDGDMERLMYGSSLEVRK